MAQFGELSEDMAKYLARSCPRCAGYLGIIMRKPAHNIPLQAINGRCLACGYRLAWVLVQGRKSALQVGTARRSSRYD
jgi:C4-type Zn-finger protein